MVNPSKLSKFKSEREELGTTLFHTSTEIGDFLRDKSHTLNWHENRMLTNLAHKIRNVRAVVEEGKTFRQISRDIEEERNPGTVDKYTKMGQMYKRIDCMQIFSILDKLYEIYNDDKVKKWRRDQAERYINQIIKSNRVDNRDEVNLFIKRYWKARYLSI